MKIRTAIFAVGIAAFIAPPFFAWADSSTQIYGVPVGLGDTVQEVKAELRTNMEPEEMATTPPSSSAERKTFIRLKTKGIWTFFNSAGRVDTIRLDAPFAGTVGGVRIGDRFATVKATLGEPIKKPFPFGQSMAYIYMLNDAVTLRVDINKSKTVETIFLIK